MSDVGPEREPYVSVPDADQIFRTVLEPATATELSGSRAIYLDKLLANIAVMLDYANKSGMALPDDLGQKLDELLASPEVRAHKNMFSKV